MRRSRIAALLVLTAAPLVAQQTAQLPPKLDVELHYTTGGDAWISTNKPAYVALFDISRTGVSQLFPVFSAQAQMQAGVERLVNLHTPAPLPAAASLGGSSLISLTAPSGGGGSGWIPRWPHMLIVVASSEPLRVGNAWASNIAINHDLFQEHHFTDTETEKGIQALVDLIRPLDWTAEFVLDRIEAVSTSVAAGASYASYDPNKVALGYDCVDGTHEYFSPVPNMGASCTALRVIPRGLLFPAQNSAAVVAATPSGTPVGADSGRAAAVKRTDATAQSISDPAAIRAFIEAMKPRGSNAFKAAAEVGATPTNASAAAAAPGAANVNRRQGEGSAPRISAEPRTLPSDQAAAHPYRPNTRPEGPMAPRPTPTQSEHPSISAPQHFAPPAGPPAAPPAPPRVSPTVAPPAAPASTPIKPPAD